MSAEPGEGEVERDHVHPGLAEEAERAALDVLLDQLVDRRSIQTPCLGDPATCS
ncbi:hypothetical protein [Kitasatospora acidiphila]|uniref:hypothetical protein n=1 Tax=Kitasatospora acidiphila TaxID=2567942 RepID=UPI003C720557